jgi:hypothetical protein
LDILIVEPVGGVETSGDKLPAGSFYAFTAYSTSMDCIFISMFIHYKRNNKRRY